MATTTPAPDFEIIEMLAEGRQASVYKAVRIGEPDRLLVLKALRTISLSETKKAHLRQKVEQLKVLHDPAAITPLGFDSTGDVCFLTQDYFAGIPLDRLSRGDDGLAVSDFLPIACSLARALDGIHEAGVIHGGVKPHNILVDVANSEIRLIDFISALDVREVSHFIYDPSFVRDTLSYTSPEQTGRISHRVGFSSDMYSLGIVFYELLTGRLPFLSDDPLELIHSHLAEEAPPVHEINPLVPATLSRIVANLMLKEPEKRYGSSGSLLADLERCRDEYAGTGAISAFPLEHRAYSRRVTFISKMVGRDEPARAILDEYEHVAGGSFRSLFISGLSGIGKTRLIQELQRPIVRHKGYFTSGKFDVYQKNIPYSSLIEAFRNLVRTFLTEDDERLAAWRSRITAGVGGNGRVLTDVIPELEVLIGPQPAVGELPPVESRNRFHDVFDRFLCCLASEENPLTLFIDDLQWCDGASFDFLESVFRNCAGHPYLFFLGAYRHNEVGAGHPLAKLIRNARSDGRPINEIRLGPLTTADCHEMVSYILDSSLGQTAALSEFISALSEGNPLFVSESLAYLHREDLLYLDEHQNWQWDLDKIRRSPMPTSVVALFGSKIAKLPPEAITLLELCACMGNTFSPGDLALIAELTLLEVFETLKPALGQGLLVENKDQLQFIHDKVQEAALAAIPDEKRRRIHWQVGNHLLDAARRTGTPLERLDNLFAIVSHLNLGRPDAPDPETDSALSQLNYDAGNKALSSLAAEAANDYFRLSRELVGPACWDDDRYERTFRIFQRSAKTELMCGHYAESEALLTELLDHARTDLDKAECLAEQTTSLSSIGNFIKAIETANQGLSHFGKAIPEDAGEAEARRAELMRDIAGRDLDVWETILDMPFTTERRSKVELVFYSELIPDLYMSGLVPQLYLSAAQSTEHCLSGGMDESVIYSFSIMGLQLGEQGEFDLAFKYEDLARDLSARHPDTFGATRGMNGIVWCNMHSRSHPRQIVDYSLKAIQCGKNCGDLYNAGLSYGPLMWNLQVQGADFAAIEETARECLEFSERYQLSFSVGLAEAMQAGWVEPMKAGPPKPMEAKLRKWEADNHVASAGSYFVHRGLSHYYLGEHEQAHEFLDGVRRYLSGLTDNVLKRQWHVFLVLNALKRYELGADFANEAELRAEIQPLIDKITTWASFGPLLRPYLAFVHAELERVTGGVREARSLYLDAIAAAHEQGYTFLEGHLNESLGELLLATGAGPERAYFTEAARLYRKCGAAKKEALVVERHPGSFERELPPVPPPDARPLPPHTLPDLDVDYLIKSSLAISADIEQDSLLKKIMNVVIEGSAAQHGYLLIEDDGILFVRAESHVGPGRAAHTLHQRLDESTGISKAIVRYVYRTGDRVILERASQDGMFKNNAEVQDLQLRSVLCVPIIKQAKMVGVLYLENRLSDAVFTSERSQMAELLMSQAAISIENARLVEDMKVAEGRVKRSLAEKEVLLREIHHRVKNNLQIIQSMLNLQLPFIRDQRDSVRFQESQDRVRSMALIHEKLYESESLTDIDLAEYVERLTADLFASYGMAERAVRPVITVGDVTLEPDVVIPCALIINELVSNALKYAFPDPAPVAGREGELRVDLHRDAEGPVTLLVADNGIGLPEGFRLERSESLGLQMVRILARQLKGRIDVRTGPGTEFVITFDPPRRGGRRDA